MVRNLGDLHEYWPNGRRRVVWMAARSNRSQVFTSDHQLDLFRFRGHMLCLRYARHFERSARRVLPRKNSCLSLPSSSFWCVEKLLMVLTARVRCGWYHVHDPDLAL
jgi:hypothetical protein